jgi:hypothetical protein
MMQQIKSRENVRSRGEVFTAEREVKAMCDLIGNDIADIEKRVLEPAAGNGNFLVEILKRRIDKITGKQQPASREFCLLVALSNIYAVELDEENVGEARQRLKDMMIAAVPQPSAHYEIAVDALLKTNIIRGDFLTKNKRAIPIYEYVPNYEEQTFDITKHTLHEIKCTARRSKTGIEPGGIGKCIDEMKTRSFKTVKIKAPPKPPITPPLFESDVPDLFEDKIKKLKAMAEQ